MTSMMLPKFQVSWPFGSGEEDGPHGSHLGFPIGTILAFFFLSFDIPVTPMLPTKFELIGLSVQEKKQ